MVPEQSAEAGGVFDLIQIINLLRPEQLWVGLFPHQLNLIRFTLLC